MNLLFNADVRLVRYIMGCLHEKTRTSASFISGWLFDFLSRLHDDWVIQYVFMLIKYTCVQNRKHYACATRSSLPTDRFHTEASVRFAFTWYRCEISYRSEILAPVQQPGLTHAGPGDSRRHDILWWYHVNNIEPWEGTGVNSRFGATHVSWKRVFFLFQYFLKLHSNLFKRALKGQHQVSVLQRGPYYRGRECMIFWFSGTKRTVRKERLDCIKFVLPNVFVGGLTLKQV